MGASWVLSSVTSLTGRSVYSLYCKLRKLRHFNVFNNFNIFFPDLKVKTDDDLIKKEQLTVIPTSSAEESA